MTYNQRPTFGEREKVTASLNKKIEALLKLKHDAVKTKDKRREQIINEWIEDHKKSIANIKKRPIRVE